jgi:hypothetical protein
MTDPKRLIDGPGDDFERALLRSSCGDEPAAGSLARTATALGIASVVVSSASTASGVAAAAAAGKLGTLVIAKWVAAGLVVGGAAVAGIQLTRAEDASVPPAAVVTGAAPATQPVAAAAQGAEPERWTGVAEATSDREPAPRTAPQPERHSAGAARSPDRGARSDPPAQPAALARFPDAPAPAARAASSSIAEEVSALDRARGAIAARQPAEALRALDEYERIAGPRVLGQEASVLRVEALLLAGDRAGAANLARRLLAAAPRSPHAPRWQAIVAENNP